MKKKEVAYSYGNLFSNLNQLIQDGKFEGKKIILFGAGFPSYVIAGYLQERDYIISAVIDNSAPALPDTFHGIPVKLPEEELAEFQDNVVVLIASAHFAAMCSQLETMSCANGTYKYGTHIFDVIDYDQIVKNLRGSIPSEKILSLQEIQEEEFKLLQYAKRVCQENQLTFFLSDGTLLGAIRHKDFIPWDDDVDISMPYNDYKKFLKIVEVDGIYGIVNNETCPTFKYGFSQLTNPAIFRQIIGFPIPSAGNLSIDIFPIYSIPDEEEKRRSVLEKNLVQKNALRCRLSYETNKEEYLATRESLIHMWEEIGFEKTKEVISTGAGVRTVRDNSTEIILPYEAYASAVQKEFHGELFPVPIGYDEVLTVMYMDYMVLPPEEKRTHGHGVYYTG